MKTKTPSNKQIVIVEPAAGKELHIKRADGRLLQWPRRISVSGSDDPIAAACASLGVEKSQVTCTIVEADEQ